MKHSLIFCQTVQGGVGYKKLKKQKQKQKQNKKKKRKEDGLFAKDTSNLWCCFHYWHIAIVIIDGAIADILARFKCYNQ